MQSWSSQKTEQKGSGYKPPQGRWSSRGGGASGRGGRGTTGGESIANAPMRQARLKPVSSLASTAAGIPIALLSSPSRGLDANLDPNANLTQAETQHQYRAFIAQRIVGHVGKHGRLHRSPLFPLPRPESTSCPLDADGMDGPARQSLHEILLFVRRLREGCVAARRQDRFTLDVYLLSTLLSLLLGDNIQLSSSLSRLVDLAEMLESETGDDSFHHGLEYNAMDDIHGKLLSIAGTKHLNTDGVRSLLLLWLTITGGRSERLGAQTAQRRAGSSLALHRRRLAMNEQGEGVQVGFAARVNQGLTRDDILGLRSLLLDTHERSKTDPIATWQLALLRRVIVDVRQRAWQTVSKAYMHLAIDGRLLDPASAVRPIANWVERIFLIDVDILPLDQEEQASLVPARLAESKQSRSSTPEAWDDSIDQLGNALQSATIEDAEDPLLAIRNRRLASLLDRFALPSTDAVEESLTLERWRHRVTMQAGDQPVIKLR